MQFGCAYFTTTHNRPQIYDLHPVGLLGSETKHGDMKISWGFVQAEGAAGGVLGELSESLTGQRFHPVQDRFELAVLSGSGPKEGHCFWGKPHGDSLPPRFVGPLIVGAMSGIPVADRMFGCSGRDSAPACLRSCVAEEMS